MQKISVARCVIAMNNSLQSCDPTFLLLFLLLLLSTAYVLHVWYYNNIFLNSFIEVTGCCWQMHFVHEKFVELSELYKSALPEEQKLLPWDLRAATIKEVLLLFQ